MGLLVAALTMSILAEPSPTATRMRERPSSSTPLRIGVTHIQSELDDGSDSGVTAAEARLLRQGEWLQNQHIMGWGATNPEPRPGQYRWGSLDRRIGFIRRTGGIGVITLCCAPDWMKGGRAGRTDWSLLEQAPDPAHYDDFAELAAQVAARYPDVAYFQVWNELKGFYDARRNTWDIEGYTRMYNAVYRAVKAVRPDAQVGGPYVSMESWSTAARASHPSSLRGPWGVVDQRALDAVEYWLDHNAGADFLTMDMRTATNDAGLTTDPFTALDKLERVVRWVRRRTALPIWIAEWYPLPPTAPGDLERQDAIVSASLLSMVETEVSTVLLWRPRGSPGSCRGCLWTVDGGEVTPTPLLASVEQVAALAAGPVVAVDTTGPTRTAASANRIFAVNTVPYASVADHQAATIRLRPYETTTRELR